MVQLVNITLSNLWIPPQTQRNRFHKFLDCFVPLQSSSWPVDLPIQISIKIYSTNSVDALLLEHTFNEIVYKHITMILKNNYWTPLTIDWLKEKRMSRIIIFVFLSTIFFFNSINSAINSTQYKIIFYNSHYHFFLLLERAKINVSIVNYFDTLWLWLPWNKPVI